MKGLKKVVGILCSLIGILMMLGGFVALVGGLFLGAVGADCGLSIEPGWHQCRSRGIFDNPGTLFVFGGITLFAVLSLFGWGLGNAGEKLLEE